MTTRRADGPADHAARRLRLRVLEALLTPTAARLGGVFIATGPFVAGMAAAGDEVDLVVALLFDEGHSTSAERAVSAAAAATGLTLRIDARRPPGVPFEAVSHLVFGERRSTGDGRRPPRPDWSRPEAVQQEAAVF